MEPQTENLPFGEALLLLQQGYAVTRAVWGGYWKMETARFTECNAATMKVPLAYTKYGQIAPAQPYWQDMLATDWRIFKHEEISLYNQHMAVLNSTVKGVYSTPGKGAEHEAAKDLNVHGYPGKWAKSKLYAQGLYPDTTSALHWDAVRLHFLELGGEWSPYISMAATDSASSCGSGTRQA